MEMAFHLRIVFLLSFLLMFGQSAQGFTKFSQLARTLLVNYEAVNGTKAGSGQVSVQWSLNTTALSAEAAAAAGYKTVHMNLCFGSISQVDRAWRKTNDLLSKDKTCPYAMNSQPFTPAGNSSVWIVSDSTPYAYYFVRAYVTDAASNKIAYGQNKTLFTVDAITGRHASIDIAAGVFSAFSVLSLFGFYFGEKKLSKRG